MVKPLIQTWDTKKCTGCMSDFPVHKDWQTQPLQCGPCRLITRKFVDAVEYLLRESCVISHPETKKVLLKLVQDASALYRKKKLDGEDPRRAWRSVERKPNKLETRLKGGEVKAKSKPKSRIGKAIAAQPVPKPNAAKPQQAGPDSAGGGIPSALSTATSQADCDRLKPQGAQAPISSS